MYNYDTIKDIIYKSIQAKLFNTPIVDGWSCILKFTNVNTASISKENDVVQFTATIFENNEGSDQSTKYSVTAYLYPCSIEESLKIDFSTLKVDKPEEEQVDTNAMLYTPSSPEVLQIQHQLKEVISFLTNIQEKLSKQNTLLSKTSIDSFYLFFKKYQNFLNSCKEFSND